MSNNIFVITNLKRKLSIPLFQSVMENVKVKDVSLPEIRKRIISELEARGITHFSGAISDILSAHERATINLDDYLKPGTCICICEEFKSGDSLDSAILAYANSAESKLKDAENIKVPQFTVSDHGDYISACAWCYFTKK